MYGQLYTDTLLKPGHDASCLTQTPFLPQFRFDKEQINALFQYSKGLFGLPILYFIYAQADIFVIGKLFSKSDLGLYSMVINLAQTPALLITSLVNPLLMPVFSQKQNDSEWINRAIIQSTKIIMMTGVPLVFFAAFYGNDLLTIIYGTSYAAMAIPFTVYLGITIMRSASVPIANVYLAIGRPELHRLFTGIRAVFIIILIYPHHMVRFGFMRFPSTALTLISIVRIRNLDSIYQI
jgi:O-antigen/teichoic acid export membrane protein